MDNNKRYSTGKHEERLQDISPTAVAWRVSLTCDKFPVDLQGELARVTVYHLRNGKYIPIRSTSLRPTDAAEWFIGGEFPFELQGLDNNRQPTPESYDEQGKPRYQYLTAEEIKVKFEVQAEFYATVNIQALERGQVRTSLGIDPNQLLNGGS